MNDILDKILANKSPEEFAKEIAEVRKIVGPDNEFDMSVEEALGISTETSIDYQEIGEIVNCPITESVKSINVSETPCTSSSNIFNQTSENDIPYSLAA